MFSVEMHYRVRRACLVEGMSVREVSRVFGVHRDTVRKILGDATPQGYTRNRPPRKPKIGPFAEVIDAILEADQRVHRKQRHAAKRIFERLRDEHEFGGRYTIVKDYVRERQRRVGEMFVPLSHGPAHAQCDFGEAMALVGGVGSKANAVRANAIVSAALYCSQDRGLTGANHLWQKLARRPSCGHRRK